MIRTHFNQMCKSIVKKMCLLIVKQSVCNKLIVKLPLKQFF